MLRSNLCDYNDVYNVAEWRITGEGNAFNWTSKIPVFKNNA